jgi:hypothetical protein
MLKDHFWKMEEAEEENTKYIVGHTVTWHMKAGIGDAEKTPTGRQ